MNENNLFLCSSINFTFIFENERRQKYRHITASLSRPTGYFGNSYERGVKQIGATSHYVTTDLDAGPIIGQSITYISHKDNVNELVKKGYDLEKIVLSHTVEKYIERKILTYKNRTVVFQ